MAKLDKDDVFRGEPAVTKIIRDLEQVFPRANPTPLDSIAKIMYLAGQQSVVEYLVTNEGDDYVRK